jgi:hypothetical protein
MSRPTLGVDRRQHCLWRWDAGEDTGVALMGVFGVARSAVDGVVERLRPRGTALSRVLGCASADGEALGVWRG